MKLSGIAIIAAIAAGTVAAAPAVAQDRVSEHKVEVHRTVTTTTDRHDNGWHHAVRRHKVCRTHWYHHHKVRRCVVQRWS